ncbi:class I SAM-dependent methyltransferase [Natrialba aegyptia]|uniref:Methyltransferase type 11 domain-containing protein n=1 Tax=Natrialba aegyptia DSM 13077 TaxID=1227491 RepID=M0B9Z6_9EURY|nr:class I SAM-dependent methyltransferase [Natrialba aegyptia]ELZ07726.1 hypothetical protein C480_06721 [Natrialba aegyptia DSM 13077]
MSPDPYGRAIRDHVRGDQTEPLIHRDGPESGEHPIGEFYLTPFTGEGADREWIESRLEGPLLDIGAGAGRHARYFQERFETVAIEVSEHLVETMRERGVRDARRADMFELRESFDRNRFRSVLAHGTQLGLAGSMQGLRRFLGDLAVVTAPEATAVLDCYDPTVDGVETLCGHRSDPTPGLAYRLLHFEYEGEVGETLLFRLFSPSRVREAAVGTGWHVAEVRHESGENQAHYWAVLEKP